MTTEARRTDAMNRRVRQFFDPLNQGDFERCYRMVDPDLRVGPDAVTLRDFEESWRQFHHYFGRVRVRDVDVMLRLGEPKAVYHGRDFATGKTTWEDEWGGQHVFDERWVREGRSWFTRGVGVVSPTRKRVVPRGMKPRLPGLK